MKSMAKILNGVEIAAAIKAEVAEEVRSLAAGGITPGLAVVLVAMCTRPRFTCAAR